MYKIHNTRSPWRCCFVLLPRMSMAGSDASGNDPMGLLWAHLVLLLSSLLTSIFDSSDTQFYVKELEGHWTVFLQGTTGESTCLPKRWTISTLSCGRKQPKTMRSETLRGFSFCCVSSLHRAIVVKAIWLYMGWGQTACQQTLHAVLVGLPSFSSTELCFSRLCAFF